MHTLNEILYQYHFMKQVKSFCACRNTLAHYEQQDRETAQPTKLLVKDNVNSAY